MPSPEGFLFHKITDIDNLRLAFYEAKKTKNDRQDIINFTKNFNNNLLEIKKELEAGNFKFGIYKYFKIYDPKERNICAARFEERIVHHAIINICKENFNKYQIAKSFANIKGKGVFLGIHKAFELQKKYKWFLKLDIKKCFETVDHDTLFDLLKKRFKDKDLLSLFKQIIDAYELNNGIGLPLGNLSSQYFANHYVAQIDYFVIQELRIKEYVRYMDDMVMWSDSKDKLKRFATCINLFTEHRLKQKLKPICINKTEKGLPFCGFVIHKDRIRLNQNSKKRFLRKFKKLTMGFNEAKISEIEYQKKSEALLSFILHADSYGFRKKCIFDIG